MSVVDALLLSCRGWVVCSCDLHACQAEDLLDNPMDAAAAMEIVCGNAIV